MASAARSVEMTSETYRSLVRPKGLVSSRVRVKQTDLLVTGGRDLGAEALLLVREARRDIEAAISARPEFQWSLVPVEDDPGAPAIVRSMIVDSARAGVGPMAAVAGAIADHVGKGLLPLSQDVIVENGGDVFVHTTSRREMLLLAENSPFRGIRIAVGPTREPLGVCTSSGTLGHSLSFGRADAVAIVARTASLADAVATSVANGVRGPEDVQRGIDRAREVGVDGVVILVGDRLGAWGNVEIVA